MITKKSFLERTQYQRNEIREWNGFKIGVCGFREGDNPWVIANKDDVFEDMTDYEYEPIKRFHTREDLWKYIKSQI